MYNRFDLVREAVLDLDDTMDLNYKLFSGIPVPTLEELRAQEEAEEAAKLAEEEARQAEIALAAAEAAMAQQAAEMAAIQVHIYITY